MKEPIAKLPDLVFYHIEKYVVSKLWEKLSSINTTWN